MIVTKIHVFDNETNQDILIDTRDGNIMDTILSLKKANAILSERLDALITSGREMIMKLGAIELAANGYSDKANDILNIINKNKHNGCCGDDCKCKETKTINNKE